MRLPLLLCAAALAACDMTPPAREGETGEAHGDAAELAPAGEAARSADLAAVDPAELAAAEVEEVLPSGPGCSFSLTEAGGPILVARSAGAGEPLRALVKLNGRLVELRSAAAGPAALLESPVLLSAPPVRAAIVLLLGEGMEEKGQIRQWQADLRFEIGEEMKAGYRGFYSCPADLE